MNYNNKIKNSSLFFKIKNTAENIYHQWLESAKSTYDLPTEFIESIKFDSVEQTFIEHLERAIVSLVEDKSDNKKLIKGWSFGYLCGHIQGSINTEWTQKYIIEPSKEYEDMIKLKSIIEYINLDKSSLESIFLIYNHLIEQRIQPDKYSELVAKNVVSIFKSKKLDNVRINEFKKSMFDLLNKDLSNKVIEALDKKNHNCCPDITNYLKYNDIKEIVGEEHFA